ncbi:MAG: non-canonical purine NTP pyrophosphatase [Roseimicrobium sp.]
MKRLLIATGNSHKTEEIRAMLGDGWSVEDLTAHPDVSPAEENGDTFEANATLKALRVSEAVPDVLVLSDDSGLEVDVLGLAPGVRSARYAGENASDADNRALLKRELALAPQRGRRPPHTGRFRCCMALAENGKLLGTFCDAIEGTVLEQEEGTEGFGYDALFVPRGFDASFGSLPPDLKNYLSHRARALAKAMDWLARRG